MFLLLASVTSRLICPLMDSTWCATGKRLSVPCGPSGYPEQDVSMCVSSEVRRETGELPLAGLLKVPPCHGLPADAGWSSTIRVTSRRTEACDGR